MDPELSIGQVIETLKHYAELAVDADRERNLDAACYYYLESSKLIDVALASVPRPNGQFEQECCSLAAKASEYRVRAEALIRESHAALQARAQSVQADSKNSNMDMERARFLLSEALDLDECGKRDEAVEIYAEAVELCIKAKQAVQDPDQAKKLSMLAECALDRAEKLKQSLQVAEKPRGGVTAASVPHAWRPLGVEGLNLNEGLSTSSASRKGDYREEEKLVIAKTSVINGREYVPFMAIDLNERFAYPMPFCDKQGRLALSAKQKSKLTSWCRPEEFMSNPAVILGEVDCFSVKQTVVSDCSFVASIAVAAQYEKRFKKRIITSLMYPQNRQGLPVYNPCGKYMVKLRLNGVARKVIIDDFFPLGAHGELLCSYSSNRSELWVSLLEKAYMKVMGGYDFPGSNSNIDLHALTGWIPERVSIKDLKEESEKSLLFKKLRDRFHVGHVLVTVATGNLSDQEADRAGLVTCHAYALLDIREVEGIRVFLLKNPWSHLRWKGNYSELDSRHWTSKMRAALNYDPKSAQNFDNGVFWIDYDSLCRFFDVFYLNWNPDLFKHTYAIHQTWKAGVGPVKDLFDISQNPQFSLEVSGGEGAVWILLSRHITEIEDFKNNKEYITVLVYKNEGRRVYYPFDPPPFLDGVRINSPHYLTQMKLSPTSPRKYTLVISQFEKSTTLHFTLRVYSTLPFRLDRMPDLYKEKKEFVGEWKGSSAGGCANNRLTFPNNPRYQLHLDRESQVLIELKGPKQFQIGFDVQSVVVNDSSSAKYFKSKCSGIYRSGFVVMPLEMIAGTYDIIPSTFRPEQESKFFLTIHSSGPIRAAKIK